MTLATEIKYRAEQIDTGVICQIYVSKLANKSECTWYEPREHDLCKPYQILGHFMRPHASGSKRNPQAICQCQEQRVDY